MSHHHNHDHHGHGHHSHEPKSYNGAFFISIIANLAYTIIQAIFAILSNSSSLLAAAAHNLGDVLGLIFAWVANLLLKKEPSATHTYGYKKTTIIASLTNALILMFTCGIILVDTLEQLFHPKPMIALTVMIVAIIGIVINGSTGHSTRPQHKRQPPPGDLRRHGFPNRR